MKRCTCPSPRPRFARVDHRPYVNPDSPRDRILFWHNIGICSACALRRVFYSTADQGPENDRWKAAQKGNHVGVLADPCLYLWPHVRRALTDPDSVIVWAEGEKDAHAAFQLGAVGTSHHGGAGKATEAQAEHFRGYRGTVLVAVDWDEPGAACALRRHKLLRAVGVRPRLVRCADGVGGGRGSGADLADHLAAGRSLAELRPLRPRDLRAAADSWAAREQQGWAYGGGVPEGFTAEDWAEVSANSPFNRGGPWPNARAISAQ